MKGFLKFRKILRMSGRQVDNDIVYEKWLKLLTFYEANDVPSSCLKFLARNMNFVLSFVTPLENKYQHRIKRASRN